MVRSFNPCKICNSSGFGLHFGVDACRGCTSFFRRTVAQEKTYYCNEDESCNIFNFQGSMCRKCRFQRCLEAGMNRNAVQRNRDPYGSRWELVSSPSTTLSSRLKFPVPSLILGPIGNNYSFLENVRLVVHLEEGSSLFTKRTPKRHTFKETNVLMEKEFKIVTDWMVNSFPHLTDFEKDQKDILLRNFYLQFFILEGGYIACKNGRNDVWFLPNGDYIDCQNLASFYDKPNSMKSEDAAKMLKGSCQSCRRMVSRPMLHENIDQFEFLALASLLLFETGLEGQSKQSEEKCLQIRGTVIRELLQYYSAKNLEDEPIRMCNVMSVIPNTQKATQKMLDDIQLGQVFNVYSLDNSFFNSYIQQMS